MAKNNNIIKDAKVSDLIEALKKLDQNSKLYLSVDEEQNALADMIAVIAYKGEVVLLPLNPQDI